MRRQWVWYLSAIVYRWTDTAPSRAVDEAILDFLGDRVRTVRVLDCGCGPGGLSEKLAARGVPRLVAVDANPTMVRQATERLARGASTKRVELRRAFVDAEF